MAKDRVTSAMDAFNVYYISCVTIGMGYIGITGWSVKRRYARHLWNAEHGRSGVLYDAIRELGAEAFQVELIVQVISWSEACDLERQFITEFQTKIPFGFNMTDGGDGNRGYVYTDEVRARMSKSGSQKRLTPEHRQRIGDNWRGRKHTPES